MDSKLLKLCIAVAVATGLNACDSGEHTNLECDVTTYQSECLDAEKLMVCGSDGMLTVQNCPNKDCAEATTTNAEGATLRIAACGMAADKCTGKANACKDALTLSKCDPNTGEMTVLENCPNGCDNTTNACKLAVDKCEGKPNACKDENTLSKCDPATGEMTVLETCPNGCDNTTNACKLAVDKCEGKPNACKDENTLSKCDPATGEMTVLETCPNGCDNTTNACKLAVDKCEGKPNACKDENTLSKCDPATGEMTLEETCPNGCDDTTNACKLADDKCEGKPNACKDENTLSKCDPATGEMTVLETCPNGCDKTTNACKLAVENTCTLGTDTSKCDEDYVLTCTANTDGEGATWVKATEACPNGCANGTCKDKAAVCGNNTVEEGEDCDGTAEITKTCSDLVAGATGVGTVKCNACKFDTSECRLYKEGASCNASFEPGCNGTQLVYCSNENKVVYTECNGLNKGTCGILDLGEGKTYADCVYEENECKTVGDTKRGCEQDDNGKIYSDNFVCYKDKISGKNYSVADSYALKNQKNVKVCPNSCLKSTGECGKIVEEEGTKCTSTANPPTCKNESKAAVYCAYDIFVAKECAANETCAVVTDGTNKASDCFAEDKKCTEANAETYVCLGDYRVKYTCFEVDGDNNNKYNYMMDIEPCEHGCDAKTNTCIKLSEQEGETCTASACDVNNKDVLLKCGGSPKKYTAQSCAKEEGKGFVCSDNEGTPGCFESCTKDGDTQTLCKLDKGASYTVKQICENSIYKDGNEKEYCIGSCAKDGQSCAEAKITACSPETTVKCYLSNKCYGVNGVDHACAESCKTEEIGQTKTKCIDSNVQYPVTYRCMAGEGENYWIRIKQGENCTNGCNDDKTACKESPSTSDQ